MDHNILIAKLEHIGIRSNICQLLRSYLTDRMQCVQLSKTFSTLLPSTCGVPQGSILGPLLFLIYINDISRSSNLLQFLLFADDTTLFFSWANKNELINMMNSELKLVSDWFKANKLSLNATKTNYILFKKVPIEVQQKF